MRSKQRKASPNPFSGFRGAGVSDLGVWPGVEIYGEPGGNGQELFGGSGDGSAAKVARCSGDRFQGRNELMSAGTRPPASAQLRKYHDSQRRGFSFHSAKVAKRENSIAAKRPLHNAPDP